MWEFNGEVFYSSESSATYSDAEFQDYDFYAHSEYWKKALRVHRAPKHGQHYVQHTAESIAPISQTVLHCINWDFLTDCVYVGGSVLRQYN
jgi:hypothetical protein